MTPADIAIAKSKNLTIHQSRWNRITRACCLVVLRTPARLSGWFAG